MHYQAITTKFHGQTDPRSAASGPAILGMLRDLANLATAATFACGIGLAAADGHAAQSAACELAAAEPTDFGIEMCTNAPIDLAPERRGNDK